MKDYIVICIDCNFGEDVMGCVKNGEIRYCKQKNCGEDCPTSPLPKLIFRCDEHV